MGGAAPPGPLGAGRGGISPAANGRPPEKGCWRERHRGAPVTRTQGGGGRRSPATSQREHRCAHGSPHSFQHRDPASLPGSPTPLPCSLPAHPRTPQTRGIIQVGNFKVPKTNASPPHLSATPPPLLNAAGTVTLPVPVPRNRFYFLPMETLHAVQHLATKQTSVPPGCPRCCSEHSSAFLPTRTLQPRDPWRRSAAALASLHHLDRSVPAEPNAQHRNAAIRGSPNHEHNP